MHVSGWGIPSATGRGKLHLVSFPFQDQVKDLRLFLIVMQQIMCKLLWITEKLLLAPICGARFLWSKGPCLQLVGSRLFFKYFVLWPELQRKKMHHLKTQFKAYLNYILGVFPLSSVTSKSEILHLLIVLSWFYSQIIKFQGFFCLFDLVKLLS